MYQIPVNVAGPAEIQSLVVVAGVSCVGKTTLLRALEEGRDPVWMPAGIGPVEPPALVCNAIDLDADLAERSAGRTVFLHYDLFRPITFHGGAGFADDPPLALLGRARRLTVVTLWEPPEVLRRRAVVRRRRLFLKKLGRRPYVSRLRENLADWRAARHRRALMQPVFDDPEALWGLYRDWFRFCAEAGVTRHWMVRPSAEAPAQWLGAEMPASAPWQAAAGS